MQVHVYKHTHTYPPQRPLCYLGAQGAAVVSFNDGEAGPGEASLSSILCGVSAHSAHHHDTDVGQRKAKRHLQVTDVSKKKCIGSLWLDNSVATPKGKGSHIKRT